MAEGVKKRRNGASRVSSKHQVTIPAEAFRGAGLREGDLLKIEADGQGRVVMTRVEDLVDKYAGALGGGTLSDEIKALREEWR